MNFRALTACFAAAALSPSAFAQSVIQACVAADGTARLVAPGTACKRNESVVAWNQTGPVGPQGPQGVSGATGVAGAAGPSGPSGPSGPTGSQGTVGATGPQGSQGVPGPAGISGLEEVFSSYETALPGQLYAVHGACPNGKRPLSGGIILANNPFIRYHVINQGVSGNSTYVIAVYNADTSNMTFAVRVNCAFVN